MAQIIPRQETVQFREFIEDKLAVVATAFQHGAINSPDRGVLFTERFGQFDRHRLGIKDIAPQQDRTNPHHVIGGFPIDQGTLSGRIGINHPANRSAVAGGKFRRKEVAVGFQKLIELIFDYARFHAYPPLFRVDLYDAVHIARHINNNALVQRLSVGARTATAWGKYQRGEPLLRRQTGNQRHICG